MKLRLNANAIIENKKGEILFMELKGGPFEGRLCIPGGGVNPGELSHETAKREILEETGIEVNQELRVIGFCELIKKEINSHRVVLLLHSIADGDPLETEEGIAKWMTYEDAKENLVPFAVESINLWKSKGIHFKLIE